MTFITLVPSIYYNVKQYGATGNGSTDDTSAIVATIAAATAAGGGTVCFPAGTYIISSPLTISSDNIGLIGVGDSSIITPGASFSGAAMIYYAGGSGIHRLSIRDLSLWGANGTYSSNPACDGIQLNSDVEDTIIDNVYFRALNGWAVQLIAGASGYIGYANLTNCVARVCKNGYHFASTVPATNRTGGIVMTNCVADNCQVGDAFYFDQVLDNVMSNCQGYCQTGSCLHIKGSAFTYIYNCDLGGATPTSPCILLEGGTYGNDHIGIHECIAQYGKPGIKMSNSAHVRITDCDIYYNQTHGIEIDDNAGNGTMLISGCHFYQNNTSNTASTYDLENLSQHGWLVVRNCTFETTVGSGASKVAASVDTPDYWAGLDIQGNLFLGGTPVFTHIHKIMARANQGYNPVGNLGGNTPSIPTSGTSQQNWFGCDCMVYVSGGTVSNIAIGGTNTGLTSGWFRIPCNSTITLTYTVAPTWSWWGE